MNQIRLILICAIGGLLISQSARADLIRESQIIGYNTGNLGADAGTGTLEGWNNSTAQVTVTNGSGSLNGTSLGLVASAGDRVFISSTYSANVRNTFVSTNGSFSGAVETNIYYSFLYCFKDASAVSTTGTNIFVRLNRANSGTGAQQHFDLYAKNVGGQIQVGINKVGSSGGTIFATTNLNQDQTFFIVVKQHILSGTANDIYDLWINPPAASFGAAEDSLPPAAVETSDGTEDTSTTGPGRFVFLSGAKAEMDEFRVATTWAEATPWLGQCVAAGIGKSPSSVTMVAELSTTFTVVPKGTSPTYQWQNSTDSGANWNNIPGANAANYTTHVLALAESGTQYRAIVNVSCNNSSATSAVATVTLTAPTPTPISLVMYDTFTDPTNVIEGMQVDDRLNPPIWTSNSMWFTAATSPTYLTVSGESLIGTPLTGASSLYLGYFTESNQPPVHLAVGTAIKVTFPFTPSGFSAFTNNAGLRFGLFDYTDGGTRINVDGPAAAGSAGNGTGVRGYMLNLDFGQTFSIGSPVQLLARNGLTDNNLMGTVADYEVLGSGPAGGGYTNATAFQAGTDYSLEFKVARSAVNTVVVSATITGGGTNWSHSVTDTNYVYHRFDAFAVRPNSLETSADSFTIPQFVVEVVSAPVTITTNVPPFSISAVESLSPTAVKITWPSVNGVSYHVLSSDSLSPASWTTNATVVATGTSTSYTNSPVSASQRYYRVLAPPYSYTP